MWHGKFTYLNPTCTCVYKPEKEHHLTGSTALWPHALLALWPNVPLLLRSHWCRNLSFSFLSFLSLHLYGCIFQCSLYLNLYTKLNGGSWCLSTVQVAVFHWCAPDKNLWFKKITKQPISHVFSSHFMNYGRIWESFINFLKY